MDVLEVLDVLEDERLGSLGQQDSDEVQAQPAACVARPAPFSLQTERLAREAGAEDVVVWHVARIDRREVARRVVTEVGPVHARRETVDLARPRAGHAEGPKGETEPAEARAGE